MLVEWTTLEDLEDVAQHRYKQEIQYFLVLSRILSVKSWQALKSFYEEYIFKRLNASQLVKQGRFAEVLSILWSVLETIRDDYDAKEKLGSLVHDANSCRTPLCHVVCSDGKR